MYCSEFFFFLNQDLAITRVNRIETSKDVDYIPPFSVLVLVYHWCLPSSSTVTSAHDASGNPLDRSHLQCPAIYNIQMESMTIDIKHYNFLSILPWIECHYKLAQVGKHLQPGTSYCPSFVCITLLANGSHWFCAHFSTLTFSEEIQETFGEMRDRVVNKYWRYVILLVELFLLSNIFLCSASFCAYRL